MSNQLRPPPPESVEGGRLDREPQAEAEKAKKAKKGGKKKGSKG